MAEINIWEQQPWETATAYDRFYTYYLTQQVPRSVERAYATWRQASGKPAAKSRAAPGSWRSMSTGSDNRTGKRIEGRLPWRVRAEAYDAYLREIADAAYKQKHIEEREKLVERLAKMGNKGLDVIDKALVNFDNRIENDADVTLSQLASFVKAIGSELREIYDIAAIGRVELSKNPDSEPLLEIVNPKPAGSDLMQILAILGDAGVINAPSGADDDELMQEPGA